MFEARQARGPSAEILLAMRASDDDALSREKRALNLDGRFALREASGSEWDAGEPLQVQSPSDVQPKTEFVEYVRDPKARGYQGTSRATVMLSPDRNAIVVLSATVTEAPTGGSFGFFMTGHYQGSFYLEAFDASSRARLAAAQGNYDDKFVGGGRESESAWIGPRMFMLPLDLLKVNWLVVLVPASTK